MTKSKNAVLSEKAKNIYLKTISTIGEMYDKVFSKSEAFRYDRAEIYFDYDAYLQAVLIKNCVSAEDFDILRLTFIENITDYGKLLDGTDLTLFASSAGSIREKLVEKADERLKEVPIAFKLSAALDSGKNLGVSKSLLSATAKIAFNFRLLGEEDFKGDNAVANSLKSVYAYLSSHGIK